MGKKIKIAGQFTSATADGFLANSKEIEYEDGVSVYDVLKKIEAKVNELQ